MKKTLLWCVTMLVAATLPLRLLAADAPAQVAQAFWLAYAAGEKEAAKAMTVRGHIESGLPLEVAIDGVKVGAAETSDGLAKVPTTLAFHVEMEGARSAECNATFETELLRIDGVWRVDGVVTMGHYLQGLENGALKCSGELMRKWLDLGEKGWRSLKEELKKQDTETLFRKLQDALMEWLRQLQEAPEKSPEHPDEKERV
ncbi:hypothetical protein [Hydrogenimonas sp.]